MFSLEKIPAEKDGEAAGSAVLSGPGVPHQWDLLPGPVSDPGLSGVRAEGEPSGRYRIHHCGNCIIERKPVQTRVVLLAELPETLVPEHQVAHNQRRQQILGGVKDSQRQAGKILQRQ